MHSSAKPLFTARMFQSAHPRKVRFGRVADLDHGLDVSIRAPAWGAISVSVPLAGQARGFNPRTRVGCDLGVSVRWLVATGFQSAHPRRVRFHISLDCASGFGFQSAHPREMDKPPLSGTKHKILYPRQHEHILFFINHANAIISIRLPERVRADGKCRPIFGSLKNCGERPRPFSLPVPVRTICWPEHCPVRSRG